MNMYIDWISVSLVCIASEAGVARYGDIKQQPASLYPLITAR